MKSIELPPGMFSSCLSIATSNAIFVKKQGSIPFFPQIKDTFRNFRSLDDLCVLANILEKEVGTDIGLMTDDVRIGTYHHGQNMVWRVRIPDNDTLSFLVWKIIHTNGDIGIAISIISEGDE